MFPCFSSFSRSNDGRPNRHPAAEGIRESCLLERKITAAMSYGLEHTGCDSQDVDRRGYSRRLVQERPEFQNDFMS